MQSRKRSFLLCRSLFPHLFLTLLYFAVAACSSDGRCLWLPLDELHLRCAAPSRFSRLLSFSAQGRVYYLSLLSVVFGGSFRLGQFTPLNLIYPGWSLMIDVRSALLLIFIPRPLVTRLPSRLLTFDELTGSSLVLDDWHMARFELYHLTVRFLFLPHSVWSCAFRLDFSCLT